MIFERLEFWLDPVARAGPEAMAVDEWLLETARRPVLRVYRWQGAWGSIGYFGSLAAARHRLPGLDWVRRWTGGGTVDHREDWTYTLAAPAGCGLAGLRGAESYRAVHEALAAALAAEGIAAHLATGSPHGENPLCFANPVGFDLVAADGRKLAGAGQRRTRHGMLHQGSVAGRCPPEAARRRGERLASALAAEWSRTDRQPPADWLDARIASRYADPAWTGKNP